MKELNGNNLISLLGEPTTNENLVTELLLWGVTSQTLSFDPSDDVDVYIEMPLKGFSLVFTDEAEFKNIPNQPIGRGSRFFSGVFFYSEGKDDYVQFNGILPFDLNFNDSITSANSKFKFSPFFERKRPDGSIISQAWKINNNRINITYTKENKGISLVAVDYKC